MGKNARDQIPPPVIHDAVPPAIGDIGLAAPQVLPPAMPNLPSDVKRDLRNPADAKGYTAPSVSELAARAITGAAGMAREYAAAAGELCRTADVNPQARANARKLLRLALAHIEA